MLHPYENTYLADIEGEEWRDVIGYDGLYNVSNFGRVKSLRRSVGRMIVRERIMMINYKNKLGVGSVKLSENHVAKTYNVAVLVADAFLRERKDGEVICHINKLKHDDRLSNLRIMPKSESRKIDFRKGLTFDLTKGDYSARERGEYEDKHYIYTGSTLTHIICTKCKKKLPIDLYWNHNKYKRRQCKKCEPRNNYIKKIK